MIASFAWDHTTHQWCNFLQAFLYSRNIFKCFFFENRKKRWFAVNWNIFQLVEGMWVSKYQTSPKQSFILKCTWNNICYHTNIEVICALSLLYFHRNNCGVYFVPAPEDMVLEIGWYYLCTFKHFPWNKTKQNHKTVFSLNLRICHWISRTSWCSMFVFPPSPKLIQFRMSFL